MYRQLVTGCHGIQTIFLFIIALAMGCSAMSYANTEKKKEVHSLIPTGPVKKGGRVIIPPSPFSGKRRPHAQKKTPATKGLRFDGDGDLKRGGELLDVSEFNSIFCQGTGLLSEDELISDQELLGEALAAQQKGDSKTVGEKFSQIRNPFVFDFNQGRLSKGCLVDLTNVDDVDDQLGRALELINAQLDIEEEDIEGKSPQEQFESNAKDAVNGALYGKQEIAQLLRVIQVITDDPNIGTKNQIDAKTFTAKDVSRAALVQHKGYTQQLDEVNRTLTSIDTQLATRKADLEKTQKELIELSKDTKKNADAIKTKVAQVKLLTTQVSSIEKAKQELTAGKAKIETGLSKTKFVPKTHDERYRQLLQTRDRLLDRARKLAKRDRDKKGRGKGGPGNGAGKGKGKGPGGGGGGPKGKGKGGGGDESPSDSGSGSPSGGGGAPQQPQAAKQPKFGPYKAVKVPAAGKSLQVPQFNGGKCEVCQIIAGLPVPTSNLSAIVGATIAMLGEAGQRNLAITGNGPNFNSAGRLRTQRRFRRSESDIDPNQSASSNIFGTRGRGRGRLGVRKLLRDDTYSTRRTKTFDSIGSGKSKKNRRPGRPKMFKGLFR